MMAIIKRHCTWGGINTGSLYDKSSPTEIKFELPGSGEELHSFLFKRDSVDSPLLMSFSTACADINGLVVCSSTADNSIEFSLEDEITSIVTEFSKVKIAGEVEEGCFEINIGSTDNNTDKSSGIISTDINIYESISIGDIRITGEGISSENNLINININFNTPSDGSNIDIKKMIFGNKITVDFENNGDLWNIKNIDAAQTDTSVELTSLSITSLFAHKLSAKDMSIYYRNSIAIATEPIDAFVVEGSNINIELLKASHDRLNVEGETLLTGTLADPTIIEVVTDDSSEKFLTIKEEGMVYESSETAGLTFSTDRLYMPAEKMYNVTLMGYKSKNFFDNFESGVSLTTLGLSVKELKLGQLSLKAETDGGHKYLSLDATACHTQTDNLYASSLVYDYSLLGSNSLRLTNLVTNLSVSFPDGTEISRTYSLEQLYLVSPQISQKSDEWTSTDFGQTGKFKYGDFEARPNNFTFTDMQIGFMSLVVPLGSGECKGKEISYSYENGATIKGNSFRISRIMRGFILVSVERTDEYYHCTFLVDIASSEKNIDAGCSDKGITYTFSSDTNGFKIAMNSDMFDKYELFGVMIDYDTKKVQ